MNLITRFNDLGEGVLTADADELRNSGVLPDGAGRSGEVRLDQIEGLGWRLIEPEQTIRFIVPDQLLAPRVLSAEAAEPSGDAEAGLAPRVDRGYGLGDELFAWPGPLAIQHRPVWPDRQRQFPGARLHTLRGADPWLSSG